MKQTWAYYIRSDGTELLGTDGALRLDSRKSRHNQLQDAREHIKRFKAIYSDIAGFFIEVGEGPNRRHNQTVYRETYDRNGKVLFSGPQALATNPATGK